MPGAEDIIEFLQLAGVIVGRGLSQLPPGAIARVAELLAASEQIKLTACIPDGTVLATIDVDGKAVELFRIEAHFGRMQ